ncbi:MAG: PH domain-containing protein [Clostridiaceae bacterium]|nr:PH domain-containing protein [Clostridiaceae bacterium]
MEYQKISRKAIGCMLVNAIFWALVLTAMLSAAFFFFRGKDFPVYLNLVYVVLLVLLWGVSILEPFVRYQRYRYRFSEEDIDVKEGFLFVRRDLVPIERLHQVAMQSGPIDRMFGLSKVMVTTAGGAVTIRFLETETAEQIVGRLKKRINQYAVKKREG